MGARGPREQRKERGEGRRRDLKKKEKEKKRGGKKKMEKRKENGKENGKIKGKKGKGKGKRKREREGEEREREIRAALIAASTAGPVGRAQRSCARADGATGKKGFGGVGDRTFGTEKNSGN